MREKIKNCVKKNKDLNEIKQFVIIFLSNQFAKKKSYTLVFLWSAIWFWECDGLGGSHRWCDILVMSDVPYLKTILSLQEQNFVVQHSPLKFKFHKVYSWLVQFW